MMGDVISLVNPLKFFLGVFLSSFLNMIRKQVSGHVGACLYFLDLFFFLKLCVYVESN